MDGQGGHLGELAHHAVAVGLPVRVGEEADGGVEGQLGVDALVVVGVQRPTERHVDLEADNVAEDERPEDPDECYDRELIGLKVRTTEGDNAGEVTDVVHLPSQDLLEVRRPAGNAVLVPLVEELVPSIDLATGYVVVADRPGLLDPEGAEVVPTDSAAAEVDQG